MTTRTLILLIVALALPALAFAQEMDFKPLTSIPAFAEIENTNNLTAFFNSLYKICIGVAAVLAVFQIVKSGIVYMMGSTGFVEKREAKSEIARAIFGLLLVLSPALVFSIIDPRILDLELNVDKLGAEGQEITAEEARDVLDAIGGSTQETVEIAADESKFVAVIGSDDPAHTGACRPYQKAEFATSAECTAWVNHVTTTRQIGPPVTGGDGWADNLETGEGYSCGPTCTIFVAYQCARPPEGGEITFSVAPRDSQGMCRP